MGKLLKSQGVVAPLASVVQNDVKPRSTCPARIEQNLNRSIVSQECRAWNQKSVEFISSMIHARCMTIHYWTVC